MAMICFSSPEGRRARKEITSRRKVEPADQARFFAIRQRLEVS